VSYSNYLKVLDPHYEREHPGFVELRTRAKEILQKERELAEIVQLVGKSALGESEKITLDVAGMLKVGQSGVIRAGSSVWLYHVPR
jgi:V-type H+-transporting ATPase subunit A